MNPITQTTPEPVVPEIVTRILAGRGFSPDEIAAFLNPSYDEHLHDPFLMTDMQPAVERIVLAAERGERVAIYGDYDIDGITASAIMIEALSSLNIAAVSYIPDRFEEGYGINSEALGKLKDDGFDLVISVDCGITSVAEATWAREHELDLIITDHHTVPEILPEAIAVINPKRPGDAYPFKELCGAGVAFKVVQALQQWTGKPGVGQEKWLLDLAALGTVCDVVPLVGENRVLASFGLRVMRKTRRPGLRALAAVGGVDISKISSQNLGFVLGPRMNAAGRLEHAAQSLELMLTRDMGRAMAIAEELDRLNQQRRADQAAIFAAADALAETYAGDPVLVLAGEDWSHGVVGIVASKLVEKWRKPTLVAQIMGDTTKGSARSVGDFNMVEALRANTEILSKFGGHFFAAGYTLPTKQLDGLRAGLNAYYRKTGIDTRQRPVLAPEATLAALDEAGWELWQALQLLEPYGASNQQPLLQLSGVTVKTRRSIGKDNTHLKLGLGDTAGGLMDSIGFGLAPQYSGLREGQRVTALGYLDQNEYNGRISLQFILKELQNE